MSIRQKHSNGRRLYGGTRRFNKKLYETIDQSLLGIRRCIKDIGNTVGLVGECEQGRAFGFDGKELIHPSQIAPCNETFSPSEAEVETARTIIDAFAEQPDAGVLKVGSAMVERLHLEQARTLVAFSEAILARAR